MLEQKKDQVGALCLLLLNLSGGEQPLLSAEAVAAGLQLFLEELDEICIDIPLAVSVHTIMILAHAFLVIFYLSCMIIYVYMCVYDDQGAQGAKMAGEMVARGLLSLSFFALLPVDGNFRSSPRAADFVLQVLRHLSADRGEDSARSLFRDAHIDLLAWVVPPPRQVLVGTDTHMLTQPTPTNRNFNNISIYSLESGALSRRAGREIWC